MKPDPEPVHVELLTIEDVMQILRVSKSWCYKDRTLPWIKVGNLKRLHPEDLQAVIDHGRYSTKETFMRHRPVAALVGPNDPID